MLKYSQKDEFILDNKKTDGVLVIPMNSQNVPDKHLKAFQETFPITYKLIVERLREGDTCYNKGFPFEEKGFKLVVIFGQMNVVGDDIDTPEDVAHVTKNIINSIIKKYGVSTKYISPIMYGEVKAWKQIQNYIKNIECDWRVYVG